MITKLKLAIIMSGRRQWQIAKDAGLDPTLLSAFANGRREPNKETIRDLAKVLRVAQKDLVGEVGR